MPPKRPSAAIQDDSESPSDSDLEVVSTNNKPSSSKGASSGNSKSAGSTSASKPKPKPKKQNNDDNFIVDDDDEEDVEQEKPKASKASATTAKKDKAPPQKKAKTESGAKAQSSSSGSKQIPEGAPGCLEGLTLLFTGELPSIERDDAVKQAKQYKSRVVAAPSGKVTHAIVGDNAGPAKLERIRKAGIQMLDEDEFLELIRTRNAPGSNGDSKPSSSSKTEAPKKSFVPGGKTGQASQPGSKEVPEGAPDCLGGLTFVFTGELTSLDRESAITLAKRYGGRVTGTPSSKTSYVVVGDNAGPSKLQKIKELKVQTVDEDGFLDLIRTRKPDERDLKYIEKQKKQEKEVMQAAKELGPKVDDATRKSQLWTVKYAPTSLKDICGNKTQVDKLKTWLEAWPKSMKSGFKKAGKDAIGTYRAVLLSGPPGVGKTTAAHLVANMLGYSVVELNASDVRSKKLLEIGFQSAIDNTSINGYFGSGSKKLFPGQPDPGDKAVLIMDEVDGMSAGDRGGVGALNALIKKSKIPIICIANDSKSQKMRPLQGTTASLVFRKPDATAVRSRMMSIAFKEGTKVNPGVIDQLTEGAQGDIRQILNMLSTYALSNEGPMDFDKGRELAAISKKNSMMTPFTAMDQLFHPQAFSANSRLSINDRLEYYFHDFGAIPLFVQENYSKHKFTRAAKSTGKDLELKNLELISKAADSISEGDLIDKLVHGSEQHWSLLPAHGIASTVRPAFFCYGTGSWGGGDFGGAKSSRAFPAWFGKNSTQNRLRGALGEVQIRMRLKISGDRNQIRQTYLPVLGPALTRPLADKEGEGIEELIELMDDYYLTPEERDSILELGLGEANGEELMKGVQTKTKSGFTREYNKRNHPIPYHKASDLGKAPKKMAAGPAPDLEDVVEVDEEVPDEDEGKEEEDEDVSKDKLVKNKAKKPKGKGKAEEPAAKKGKAKK